MIFVHSSFRTSSTWLWSCFRRAERTVAYCEVLNEALASVTPAQISNLHPGAWYSKHPNHAPYWLEYLPLIQDGGGVRLFDAAMAFERFVPLDGPSGAISDAEIAYLASLVKHAKSLGRTPVLTATRSLGRLAGIKAAFPGLHILLYRNLFEQWCSYTEQCLSGNPQFLDTIRKILVASGHDTFLRDLHQLFPLDEPSVDSAAYFWCFVFLHLHLYAHAACAADLVIDVSRLAEDKEYRRRVEQQIGDTAGIAVDLSDALRSRAYSLVHLGTPEHMMEQLRPIADVIAGQAPGQAGSDLVMTAVSDLSAAYARYIAQAGPPDRGRCRFVRAARPTRRSPCQA